MAMGSRKIGIGRVYSLRHYKMVFFRVGGCSDLRLERPRILNCCQERTRLTLLRGEQRADAVH